jgi:SAM-dependent methyltransferase
MRKLFKRLLFPVNWKNLRTTKPLSSVFGFDRGSPIDRYYIEKFLNNNRRQIRGRVLEIAENTYTLQFGEADVTSDILSYSVENHAATIVGDLTKTETLPANAVDCFICTQTFNFIYDFKKAIAGAYHILKPGGTLLVTLAGLSQISQYDMERWGDFWRFTTKSAEAVFAEIFGKENIQVNSHGNVLAAVSFLHGLSQGELTEAELDVHDPNYQIIITVVAKKC